jgi:hypothetical protein
MHIVIFIIKVELLKTIEHQAFVLYGVYLQIFDLTFVVPVVSLLVTWWPCSDRDIHILFYDSRFLISCWAVEGSVWAEHILLIIYFHLSLRAFEIRGLHYYPRARYSWRLETSPQVYSLAAKGSPSGVQIWKINANHYVSFTLDV